MKNSYYVLHVKRGYEDRERSILSQFAKLGLDFEWILDYDREDITQDVLSKYKYGGILRIEEISCCLKHISSWKRIASGDSDGGFVFEDDVLIDLRRFKRVVEEAITEFSSNWHDKGCIYLGNACALRVPWTKRKKEKKLYLAEHVRATDSYWINKETAKLRLEWITENGFSLAADHLINRMDEELGIPFLWLEPTVVSQGSHTGRFSSGIQEQDRGTLIDRIGWTVKKIRRQYIYPVLGIDTRFVKRDKK